MSFLLGPRRLGWGPIALACCLAASACSQDPLPDLAYQRQPLSGEVYRIFCLRAGRSAYPNEVSGDRFYPLCDGEQEPEDEDDPRLRALLTRRPEIIAALEQVFAERPVEGQSTFHDDELSQFMLSLVELYDKPHEYVPLATRGIADMLERLLDENDARASAVIETVARLSARTGYRPPDKVLGALRPILSYERFDILAKSLLKEVAEGGHAHEAFKDVLEALALELADEPVAPADPNATTLGAALALLFASDDRLAGPSGPAWVLRRNDKGDAQLRGADDDDATPFPVLGRQSDVERDPQTGVALREGEPMYELFNANRTVLAAGMREASALIAPGEGGDRSPLEYAAQGLKPLLGPWTAGRSQRIGKADYAFTGPELAESPLLDLVHALGSLARYPETARALQLIAKLLEAHESEATALVYAGLNIDAISDEYEDAKLTGWDGKPGSPHELWDDLIAAAERMSKRPGLYEALVRSFADPRASVQGKVFANWMRYKDEVTWPNSPSTEPADFNTRVEHPYREHVARSEPDVGMNRSIWQRTMSLIAGLNGVQICNKDKAVLSVHTDALGTLTFPSGYPLLTDGYKACELIEVQDAIEIYARSVLGEGRIEIKDAFATLLAGFGEVLGITGNVGQIQEQSSQIEGFTDKPSAASLTRFMYGPRNEFLTSLFDPPETNEKLPLLSYEPNAMFPLENADPRALLDGEAQSFETAGFPLLAAFDESELRDPLTGKLSDGYMFGHLMSVVHRHWSAPRDTPCPAEIGPGEEGCTQRLDPSAPLYAPQSNLVSYEELLARALDEEDLFGHLHRAATKLVALEVDGQDGAKVLGEFVQRLITPDRALAKRNGDTFTTSNTCELVVEAGKRSCKDGRGRVVEVLSPLYLLLDALKRFDEAFAAPENTKRHEAWLTGRGHIVDLLLTVDEGSEGYALRDRNAYAIAVATLPWVSARIAEHQEAGDLDAWSAGLSGRLEKVLAHPLSAAVVELLDVFWDIPETAREFDAVASYLMNEEENGEAFQGMLVAAADMLTLLDSDPALSPAIQFAALALAPNAFEAVDDEAAPDVQRSVAFAGLELAKNVTERDDKEPSTLSKLLKNSVLSDEVARSPLEVLIDATADVNRKELTAPPEQALSAEEDRHAFQQVSEFLSDDERGLERLYQVIQGRKVEE